MVRLRTHTPEGQELKLRYRYGGDFLIVPVEDYEKTLHQIVVDHPNLTQGEKDLLDNNFVYVVAVEVDEEGNETPYLGLTPKEFDILYNTNMSGIWRSKTNPSEKYQVIEIPRMFDRKGERALMYLFGKGYAQPKYTLCVAVEDLEEIIEPDVE